MILNLLAYFCLILKEKVPKYRFYRHGESINKRHSIEVRQLLAI